MTMDFLTAAKAVKALTGKPVSRQLREALALRLGQQRIGISEYFEYGLWDPKLSADKRAEFIGWRTSAELDRRLNSDHSRVLANDKLINYIILNALGFPMPRPLATYSVNRRRIANEILLRTRDEVRSFLASTTYPVFVKPISAGYGRGVSGLAGFDGTHVQLLDGTSVEFGKFFAPFEFLPFQGMLFQECAATHPAIQELTGSTAICCIRMICLVSRQESVIHTAFLKIVTGRNMLDNFSHGDYGNLLAAIDTQQGVITHAIRRIGPEGAIERHPDTGMPLIGFRLPDWESAIVLVRDATRHFPGLGIQNWDVALTPSGPVIIELNTESELAVPQAINHRGMMDERLKHGLQTLTEERQAAAKSALAGWRA
ncbi:MAG: sugar-transfer associated ATP-grasp domain-containing protein [Rhodocyclaceae bacterium]|nr:sugar-transfer associated ATP-grasp domain-containing protein [Rhodocyclaceae bacterium]